jgi:predicted O-methyltransferase YrrM
MTAGWTKIDGYIADHLVPADDAAARALDASAAAGLPAIAVSPPQGKMLTLLARMARARRILEIGTLGGYSTIWLARALPPEGRVVTLEIDPHHADVARANIAAAGLGQHVDIRVGPALDTLGAMAAAGEAAFDFIFVDASKAESADYLRAVLPLSHPGTVLLFDNVVRAGAVGEPGGGDAVAGIRALFEAVAADSGLSATAIQTVGEKGWDGFSLAIVRE